MDWIYNGQVISSDFYPNTDSYGYVYKITYEDGREYLGQKQFFNRVKLKPKKDGTTREGAIRIRKRENGKMVPYEIIFKESDWRTYEGSSKNVKDLVVKSKEILELATSKRHLTYLEAKYLFVYDVLENDKYLNDNILGKFFAGNLR